MSSSTYVFLVNYLNVPKVLLLLGFLIFSNSCTIGYRMLASNKYDDPAESQLRADIVRIAKERMGDPYRKGGKQPGGFDCSGFTAYVLKEVNISMNASAETQFRQGKLVDVKNLQPGDLVFFENSGHIHHVGIITSNKGNSLVMVHASTSRGVIEEDIMSSPYWQKRLKGGRDLLNP